MTGCEQNPQVWNSNPQKMPEWTEPTISVAWLTWVLLIWLPMITIVCKYETVWIMCKFETVCKYEITHQFVCKYKIVYGTAYKYGTVHGKECKNEHIQV